MNRIDRNLLFNLIRFAFVMLMVINALTIFTTYTTDTAVAATETGAAVDTGVLDEDVGGLTQLTGIPTILISIGMVISAFGLFTNKDWAFGSAMTLIAVDIVFKTINILSELVIGTAIIDLWIGLSVLVLEGALYYAMRRYQREVINGTAIAQAG